MANAFDPELQKVDITSKLVVGLERLSEVFRVLLWDKAKETGLSPIQIQILLFIKTHKKSLANVSDLAKEFNLKKPTVSDAIKALFTKQLVSKDPGEDGRAYTLLLTEEGTRMTQRIEGFEGPLTKAIEGLSVSQKTAMQQSLRELIFELHQAGIIEIQRTCFGCRFYEKSAEGHYCQFIEKKLNDDQLRLDCEDYQIPLKQ